METQVNILQTKFFAPKVGESTVHRARLTRMIEDGLERRVVLISAPPGFGKTSLLADWMQEYDHSLAWLTLDESDNDPIHFMDYFLHAPVTSNSSKLRKLVTENQPRLKGNLEDQMDILINCILDSGENLIIILDDYHHIHSPIVHKHINYFIENMPANAHVILATRSDPPLNLANWRVRGYLSEIRQVDLSFRESEAHTFFNNNLPFDFSLEETRALNEKIEGWVAGMQLAASAISKQKNRMGVERFIMSFKGTNRYILDYLMEQVLRNQPQDIREFLLYTSLLDRFCAPLCDQILGRKDSQELLDYLDRNNLFVFPLDSQRKWYRYHRLFADLLKSQINNQEQEKITQIHTATGKWYEQHEYFSEAIDQWFLAGDTDNAARLIQSQAKHVLNQSEFVTFESWIKRLPERYLKTNPTLCSYYAITLIMEGRPYHEIKELLEIMDQMETGDKFSQTIVQVFISMAQGNYNEAARSIQIIKQNPPKEDDFLIGLLDIAQTILLEGDIENTLVQLLNTHNKAELRGNLTIAVTSQCFMGDLYKCQGKLHKAFKTYKEALKLAVLEDNNYLPAASVAFLGMGEIYYKWGRLEEAEDALKKSINLAVSWEIVHFFSGLTTLARVQIARGKFEDAVESMQKAEELALQFDTTEIDDFVVACRVIQLKMLMGEKDEIEELDEQFYDSIPKASWKSNLILMILALANEIQELTHAWVLLHKDKYSAAIPILRDLYRRAQKSGMDDYAIQYAVLLSVAYYKNREKDKAIQYIGIALEKAKPENQIQVFLEQGSPLMEILYEAAQRGIVADFAGKVLACFPQMEAGGRSDEWIYYEGEIIEPLSQRETEVLGLIAQGRSNREIASALFLSLSTIKVHIYNIFRKLNVHNRTQAVAKAKTLNIIS